MVSLEGENWLSIDKIVDHFYLSGSHEMLTEHKGQLPCSNSLKTNIPQ